MSASNPWTTRAPYDAANVGITGTQSTGIPVLLSSSYVAVSVPADTTEDTLVTIPVAAGTFGSNGALRISLVWTVAGAGGNKTTRVRYSTAAGTAVYTHVTAATSGDFAGSFILGNKNSTSAQVTMKLAEVGSSFTAVDSSVDTTAATSLVITGQKVAGADTLTLKGYIVEYIKASNA